MMLSCQTAGDAPPNSSIPKALPLPTWTPAKTLHEDIGRVFKNQWKVLVKLGSGAFGHVWLCQQLGNCGPQHRYVAIKVVKIEEEVIEEVARDEVEFLLQARSCGDAPAWGQALQKHRQGPAGDLIPSQGFSSVVRLLHAFTPPAPKTFQICLVQERMGPSVAALIQHQTRLQKPMALALARKISCHTLLGLDFLHRICGIVHMDIKPGNLLVSYGSDEVLNKEGLPITELRDLLQLRQPVDPFSQPSAVIKVADLGNGFWTTELITSRQTRPYQSPETITLKAADASADIWSMGCVLFELLTNDWLCDVTNAKMSEEKRDRLMLRNLVEVLGPLPEPVKGEWSEKPKAKGGMGLTTLLQEYELAPAAANLHSKFLGQMLQLDPAARKTAEELLHDPWFELTRQAETARRGAVKRQQEPRERATKRARAGC